MMKAAEEEFFYMSTNVASLEAPSLDFCLIKNLAFFDCYTVTKDRPIVDTQMSNMLDIGATFGGAQPQNMFDICRPIPHQ